MKVRSLLFVALATICCITTNAQWFYDFGTGTGVIGAGESYTFLPQPTPNPDAGADYVRIGAAAGTISLVNPGTSVGDGSEVSATASATPSANKISIYDYTAGKTFFTRFQVRFDGATSGEWLFLQGDGDRYSNGFAFLDAQTFTGLRFTYGVGGTITIARRTNILTWVDLATQPVTQGNNYVIEIIGNNSTALENYNYPLIGPQTVAPNTFDLWIEGVLVGDDLGKASFPDDTNIDSYMFYGINSAGNAATIVVDNLRYANSIAASVLPVKFSAISASEKVNGIQIDWTTYSEMNVDHYEVERSSNGTDYFSIGRVISTNSSARKQYSYLDGSANGSTYFYRVRSFDRDGKQLVSPIVRVGGKQNSQLILFPNPVRDKRLSLQVTSLIHGTFELQVFNGAGQQVYRERLVHNGGSFNHGLQLPQTLKAGVYSIQIVSDEISIVRSFIIER